MRTYLVIDGCDDHPPEEPCYIRGTIVLTEEGPQFAYHSGITKTSSTMKCGMNGCETVLSVYEDKTVERRIEDLYSTIDWMAQMFGCPKLNGLKCYGKGDFEAEDKPITHCPALCWIKHYKETTNG
jgi:hypothetical protein